MKAKLATVNLQSADPQRSKRFYVDVLGMTEDTQRSHPPSFVYLRSDGCDITIASSLESSAALRAPSIELGFEADDIAAMRSHLAASGVPDFRDESMGWGEALELQDPDGHQVLIYSFRRGSPSVSG
jgi:catechol 2,3-dioxygenase-like lactoylglutathione lyase family enzyme